MVEQLASHCSVIRPNYAEPVAGTDSGNAPRVSDFADGVVAAAGAGGKHRFDLVGHSLGAAVATFMAAEYSEMVRSLVPGADGQDCPWKATSRERPQPRLSLSVRRKYHQRNHPELCGDE
jgi:pimeloyl-ACP methyl ester carboxylesterase